MPTYRRDTHRFFDGLITYLVTVACVGPVLKAHKVGCASVYGPDATATIEGKPHVSGRDLRFTPHDMMRELACDGWPVSLDLVPVLRSASAMRSPWTIMGSEGINCLALQAMFVRYYESQVHRIKSSLGPDPQRWPSEWRFGRVVRNAFAHGGQIHFDASKAPCVQWKTLEYGPSDNGREILFQDMAAVEVILLMDEMDAAVGCELGRSSPARQ